MTVLVAIVELLVGWVCLGFAVLLWRRTGAVRVLAAVLAIAGAAAIWNAVASLAT